MVNTPSLYSWGHRSILGLGTKISRATWPKKYYMGKAICFKKEDERADVRTKSE